LGIERTSDKQFFANVDCVVSDCLAMYNTHYFCFFLFPLFSCILYHINVKRGRSIVYPTFLLQRKGIVWYGGAGYLIELKGVT
jgi:hypothetical protein